MRTAPSESERIEVMATSVQVYTSWLRRTVPWPASGRAWGECLAGVSLVVAAVALYWFGGTLTSLAAWLLWGLLLTIAAVLLRRSGVSLLGPVLWYDMVRTARQGRMAFARWVYAALLFVLVFAVYLVWFPEKVTSFHELFAGAPLPASDLAQFAASFGYVLLAVQLAAVFLLTPAYTAGALAEERERGTLDALLATDLRGREIVLSILVSRLSRMALLVATALPIMGILQFLGGIDPSLVLAAFAVTGLSLTSIGSLSILCSVYAQRPREAILRAYLVMVGYLLLSALAEALPTLVAPASWNWVIELPLSTSQDPVRVHDALTWFAAGNPLVFSYRLAGGFVGNTSLASLVQELLREYATFHGLTALVCLVWTLVRFRPLVLQPASLSVRPTAPAHAARRLARRRGPHIGNQPVLWKALVVESRGCRSVLRLFLTGIVLAAMLLPAVHLAYCFDRLIPHGAEDRLSGLMNLWVRGASAILGCLMLAGVALRAGSCMSGERDRQTLDGLLATPLSNRTLLLGMWLGSILSPRGLAFGLGLVWLTGLITGSLHPAAILCFLIVWLAYAALLASAGLWCSIHFPTTGRSLFAALLMILVVLGLFLLACYDVSDRWLTRAEAYSLWPPVTLALLPFSAQTFGELGPPELVPQWLLLWPVAAAIGAAALLWLAANARFQVVTGRAPGPEPEPGFTPPVHVRPAASPRDGVASSANSALVLRDPWRWPKRLARAAILLLPLVLMGAGYRLLSVRAQEELDATVAQLDRSDPGWRLEDLEAARKAIPDEQNAAPLILEAHQLMPAKWPDKFDGTMQDSVAQAPEKQLRPDQLQALRADLQSAAPALTVARRMADRTEGRFPHLSSSNLPYAFVGTEAQETRGVAFLLALDAVRAAQEGDSDRALLDCRSVLNTAHVIGDEPWLILQHVRLSIRTLAVQEIERALAQGEPHDVAMKSLQDAILREEAEPILQIGLRGNRADYFQVFKRLGTGDNRLWNFFDDPKDRFGGLTREMYVLLLSGSYKAARASLLARDTQLIQVAALPYAPQKLQLGTIQNSIMNIPLFRQVVADVTRLADTYHTTRAQLRCALAALAAERYCRRQGHWPESLALLAPEFLPSVPTDPFDGKPLRYRRLADGVIIYAIGTDGIDNGGKLNRKSYFPAGLDVGIQLWDVSKRRQPPAERAPGDL
jgi:ABC-type transport system involved in multi-copper enzyme maturation permease subunit